jgi:hypothetical protein
VDLLFPLDELKKLDDEVRSPVLLLIMLPDSLGAGVNVRDGSF